MSQEHHTSPHGFCCSNVFSISRPDRFNAGMTNLIPIRTLNTLIMRNKYSELISFYPDTAACDRIIASSLYFVSISKTGNNEKPDYFTLHKPPTSGAVCVRLTEPFAPRVGVNWVEVEGQKYVYECDVTKMRYNLSVWADPKFLAVLYGKSFVGRPVQVEQGWGKDGAGAFLESRGGGVVFMTANEEMTVYAGGRSGPKSNMIERAWKSLKK